MFLFDLRRSGSGRLCQGDQPMAGTGAPGGRRRPRSTPRPRSRPSASSSARIARVTPAEAQDPRSSYRGRDHHCEPDQARHLAEGDPGAEDEVARGEIWPGATCRRSISDVFLNCRRNGQIDDGGLERVGLCISPTPRCSGLRLEGGGDSGGALSGQVRLCRVRRRGQGLQDREAGRGTAIRRPFASRSGLMPSGPRTALERCRRRAARPGS
jgi:hypothetical protein